jgi:hypothetical protein
MEFPVGVSDAECALQGENYRVTCVSQFDQVWAGGHGDYNPACSASTETVTPRPVVIQPSDDADYLNIDWTTLTTAASAGFEHKIELDEGVGNTVLLWSAVDGGPFHAKMIHRGHVGWMAFGLAHPCGAHNGMNGGQIVMGLKFDDDAPSVDEYRIHEYASAFRHWLTPLSESESESVSIESASFTMENGVSILEFSARSIYKKVLNLTSSNSVNTFIWAITHREYCTAGHGGYCGYHSAADGDRDRRTEFRGVFKLDLASGERGEKEEEDCGEKDEETDAASGSLGPTLAWTAAVAALTLVAS